MRVLPVVLGAMALAAAAVGLIAGQRAVRLDPSAHIARFAALYVAETGGQATDCIGVPGAGEVWLTVRCSGEVRRVYDVTRRGRLAPRDPAPGGT